MQVCGCKFADQLGMEEISFLYILKHMSGSPIRAETPLKISAS